MKRLILQGALSAAALIAVAAPPPAFADVTVTATINKIKDVSVAETINIDKSVSVTATVTLNATKAAEGDTIVNQSNTNNHACDNCAEKLDWIWSSINDNHGAIAVNQAAGNMNNQGNAVTAAVDSREFPPGNNNPPPPPPNAPPGGFANAQASVDQRMGVDKRLDQGQTNELGRPVYVEDPDPNVINSVNIVFRDADIQDSINHNTGIVQVNQSAGNINNQANTVTLALALSGGVALSEADLGQANAYNSVHERHVNKGALIDNSVNANAGLVEVNQTSGNFANQANVVSLGAAIAVQ
jgi:hypothetical protein